MGSVGEPLGVHCGGPWCGNEARPHGNTEGEAPVPGRATRCPLWPSAGLWAGTRPVSMAAPGASSPSGCASGGGPWEAPAAPDPEGELAPGIAMGPGLFSVPRPGRERGPSPWRYPGLAFPLDLPLEDVPGKPLRHPAGTKDLFQRQIHKENWPQVQPWRRGSFPPHGPPRARQGSLSGGKSRRRIILRYAIEVPA